MKQRMLLTLALAAMFFFLAGCKNSASESNRSLETQAEPIIPNLPSISELAGTPAPEIQPLPTLSSDQITIGQKVYSENCAECHGEDLEGEPDWQEQNEDNSFRSPPHDASGHTWHHGDKVLIESIRLGGERLPDNIGGFSDMPAYIDTLTEEKIAAVLTFIKSQWPDDLRRLQWEQTNRELTQ
jgi:mono/diheme cytochrome c family protein